MLYRVAMACAPVPEEEEHEHFDGVAFHVEGSEQQAPAEDTVAPEEVPPVATSRPLAYITRDGVSQEHPASPECPEPSPLSVAASKRDAVCGNTLRALRQRCAALEKQLTSKQDVLSALQVCSGRRLSAQKSPGRKGGPSDSTDSGSGSDSDSECDTNADGGTCEASPERTARRLALYRGRVSALNAELSESHQVRQATEQLLIAASDRLERVECELREALRVISDFDERELALTKECQAVCEAMASGAEQKLELAEAKTAQTRAQIAEARAELADTTERLAAALAEASSLRERLAEAVDENECLVQRLGSEHNQLDAMDALEQASLRTARKSEEMLTHMQRQQEETASLRKRLGAAEEDRDRAQQLLESSKEVGQENTQRHVSVGEAATQTLVKDLRDLKLTPDLGRPTLRGAASPHKRVDYSSRSPTRKIVAPPSAMHVVGPATTTSVSRPPLSSRGSRSPIRKAATGVSSPRPPWYSFPLESTTRTLSPGTAEGAVPRHASGAATAPTPRQFCTAFYSTEQKVPPSARRCRFCTAGEQDNEEHMLLRCNLHAPIRSELVRHCEAIVPGCWSAAADDKERYKLLLMDSRVQQPLNMFFKKCLRARDSSALPVFDAHDGARDSPAELRAAHLGA